MTGLNARDYDKKVKKMEDRAIAKERREEKKRAEKAARTDKPKLPEGFQEAVPQAILPQKKVSSGRVWTSTGTFISIIVLTKLY